MVLTLDLWKQSLCHGSSTRLMEAGLNSWMRLWIHEKRSDAMKAA